MKTPGLDERGLQAKRAVRRNKLGVSAYDLTGLATPLPACESEDHRRVPAVGEVCVATTSWTIAES